MRNSQVRGLSLFVLAASGIGSILILQCHGKEESTCTYRNEQYNYCFQFPTSWKLQESIAKNGALLGPSDRDRYIIAPTITVGARSDQPSEQKENQMQSLEENVQEGLQSLKEYGGAEEIKVTEEDQTSLSGVRALTTIVTYKNSKTGREWLSKDVTAIDDREIVYFIELRCDREDQKVLLPIFDQLVRSFKMLGKGL